MNTENFNNNLTDETKTKSLHNELPLVDEEDTPQLRKPSKVGRVVVCAVLAVGLIGGGVAFAVNGAKPAEEPTKPTIEQKKDEQVKQSTVKLTIEAEGADVATGATKAKITATDKDGKEAIKEFEVEANKEAEVGKLDPGTYELHVTCAPVLTDGATYKLPDTPQKFEVNKDGKVTTLKVKLEAIAKADMTKEQLEAAAGVLSATGNAQAAEQVASAAKSAPSVEGSANAVQRPATPSNNGGNSSSTPSVPSGGNSGGNTPAPAPAPAPTPTPTPTPVEPHQHSWVNLFTEHPAEYGETWIPNWVHIPRYTCGTCGAQFSTPAAATQHQKDNIWTERPCGAYYSDGYEEDHGYYGTGIIKDPWKEYIGCECTTCGERQMVN